MAQTFSGATGAGFPSFAGGMNYTPSIGFGEASKMGNLAKGDSKGWNFGDWSQKNPKTAGFLKGFMASRGMTGSGAGSGAGEGKDKDKKPEMFGFGSTTRQLAEGLTETRDPFYMHTTPGQYIRGKKGFGRIALDTGLGALTGFMAGGPPGAVAGTLGGLSQNLDEFG